MNALHALRLHASRPHLPRPHLPRPHRPHRPHFGRPHPGPGMSLYLLSPVIAELMLGSTPPIPFLVFGWADILLYGGGVVLIRELALRWKKGWPTIVALGVAYAIAEEGIAVRTFFNPDSGPLSGLRDYGWLLGANWVWIAGISLYHAFVSIALPIMLVTMYFPDRAKEPWVDTRFLRRSTAGLVFIVSFFLVVYQIPAVDGRLIVGSLLAIGLVVWIARRLPERIEFGRSGPPVPSPRRVVIVTSATIFGIFMDVYGRGFGTPPIGAIAISLGLAGLLVRWIGRNASQPEWSDRHRFALAVGVFSLMWLFSFILELGGTRGQLLVAIVGIWASRRVWVRLRTVEADRLAAAGVVEAAELGSPAAAGYAAGDC